MTPNRQTIKATRTMDLTVALVGRQKLAGVSGQGGSSFDAPQGKLGALAGIVGDGPNGRKAAK